MRYLTEDDFFICSQEAQRNGGFFIPYGTVFSDDPTDNLLNLPFLGSEAFNVSSIVLMDYETRSAASFQPTISINRGAITEGGQTYSYILAHVYGLEIQTKCFYFDIQLETGEHLYTEVFILIDFDDCKNYVRIESKYPKNDFMIHDLEKEDNGLRHLNGGVFWAFANGAKFKNALWFEGNIKWSSAKIQKTYEGLNNYLTKQKHIEEYEIFSPKMPDWYAREVVNVMGGAELRIFNNQRETAHKTFEVTEFELQKAKVGCFVLPTGKIRAYEKTTFFGCMTDTGTIQPARSAACRAFLNATVGTFEYGYGSGLRTLYLDFNLPYDVEIDFSFHNVISYSGATTYTQTDTFTGAQNYTIGLGDILTGVIHKGLLVMTDETPFQNPALPVAFYVDYIFSVAIHKPETCLLTDNGGYETRTLTFKTRIYKDETGFITANPSEEFLNKLLVTP